MEFYVSNVIWIVLVLQTSQDVQILDFPYASSSFLAKCHLGSEIPKSLKLPEVRGV